YDNKIKPVVKLYDLERGEAKPIFKDPRLNIDSVRWALDGSGIYATNVHNSQPQFNVAGITQLFYHDVAKNEEQRIDLDWERGVSAQWDNSAATGLVLTRDGFLALLANGVHGKLARFTRRDGKWERQWLTSDKVE